MTPQEVFTTLVQENTLNHRQAIVLNQTDTMTPTQIPNQKQIHNTLKVPIPKTGEMNIKATHLSLKMHGEIKAAAEITINSRSKDLNTKKCSQEV